MKRVTFFREKVGTERVGVSEAVSGDVAMYCCLLPSIHQPSLDLKAQTFNTDVVHDCPPKVPLVDSVVSSYSLPASSTHKGS